MQITLLGTGTSHGVPMLDCAITGYATCPKGVCLKARTDPRHRRSRSSLWVQTEHTSILIDTSQDFRTQMLENCVTRIDAVLYTHGHADHIYGLPDIRSYCRHQGDAMEVYGSPETLDILQRAFDYIFHPPAYVGGGIPTLRLHPLEVPDRIAGLEVKPIPVEHGPLHGCQGYRLNDLAYIPDVKVIPPASLECLRGLDLLVLNCLRLRPHGSHLCLEESLAYVDLLRPKRCLLTHMTHDIDYAQEEPKLPANVRFAYDGLVVEV